MAKNPNFGQILTFGGLLYRLPFTDEGRIWCATADPRCTLMCQISSRLVYSIALYWRKTPIFQFFWLRHLVVSPIGSSLTKLNMATQLQTFPYPTASMSFLYSRVHNLWRSKARRTNKQTNKQTNRHKTHRFWPPQRGWVKSEPHQTWHGDRGVRERSCISKTFGVWRIVSPLGGAKI